MDFSTKVRTIYRDVPVSDYFSGVCPSCGAQKTSIRTSRVREVQELGTTDEKVIVRLKVNTYLCRQCNEQFTPLHPCYPKNCQSSLTVIKYALKRSFQHNTPSSVISRDLAELHNVDVKKGTIRTWLSRYSKRYAEATSKRVQQEDFSGVRTVTIDGTFMTAGKDIIGKKKSAGLLYVIRLGSERYLLTW